MKAIVMIAALATSAVLVTPTVANAATPVDLEPITVTVSAAGLSEAAAQKRLARAVGRFCAEREMRGADRTAMEQLCLSNFRTSAQPLQLALLTNGVSPRRA